jgi:hypothetical protein
MRQKQHEAIAYMVSHPRRVAVLAANRFIAIWTGGTPHPLKDFKRNHSLWFRYVLLFNVFAAVGALAGIVLLFWKRSMFAFPLAVFPVVFPWVYYISLALPRYRLPIDPVVILLAAIALSAAIGRVSRDGARSHALP